MMIGERFTLIPVLSFNAQIKRVVPRGISSGELSPKTTTS